MSLDSFELSSPQEQPTLRMVDDETHQPLAGHISAEEFEGKPFAFRLTADEVKLFNDDPAAVFEDFDPKKHIVSVSPPNLIARGVARLRGREPKYWVWGTRYEFS